MSHDFYKNTKTPENENSESVSRELGSAAVRYPAEHSRSIDDREKYQALDVLRELGVLAPLAELDTYHGRARKGDDEESWQVDPYFRNGGNDSGNRNVFNVPVVYTSDLVTATDFARARAFQDYHAKGEGDMFGYFKLSGEDKRRYLEKVYKRVDVHDVVSLDTDATVIRSGFSFTELSEDDKSRYHESMRQLLRTVPLAEGTPLGIESPLNVQDIQSVLKRFIETRQTFQGAATIEQIEAETGIKADDVRALASVYNARNYIWKSPWSAANSIQNDSLDVTEKNDEKGQAYPVSLEYIRRFFRESHIVGQESAAISATLDRRIDMVTFFDLQKVNTSEQYEKRRDRAGQTLLPIAQALDAKLPRFSPDRHDLFDVVEGAYVKPSKLINAAKGVPGFNKVFEGDSGNWEGYTLGEHTETVLRNFDENFSEEVPVELLRPLRLAILVHDIGKSAAVKMGEKQRQNIYNRAGAEYFLQTIGVDPRVSDFIVNMTDKGMSLAAESAVFGHDQNLPELRRYAATELKNILGSGATEDVIDGYLDMCEMLVTCDGGSYTKMAVTRRSQGLYRNYASFDDSFKKPSGPGKRDLRLKNSGIAKRSRR